MVDARRAAIASQRALARLASTCGYTLDPKKRQIAAANNIVLGVAVDVAEAHKDDAKITFSPVPARVAAILDTIAAIRERGSISHGEADSLLGKLQFVATSTFSRLGRAANAPLRIIANHGDAEWADVDRCLRFMESLLPTLRPRVVSIPRRPQPPEVILYTDASLEGLGVVIYAGDRTFWSATPVTPELMASYGMANIADLEGLAALAGLHMVEHLQLQPRSFVHFIDNTHVCSNLISGYSRQTSLVTLMLDYYTTLSRMDALLPWHEYVPSAANISDIPSRNPLAVDLHGDGLLASDYRAFVFPPPTSLWTTLTAPPPPRC